MASSPRSRYFDWADTDLGEDFRDSLEFPEDEDYGDGDDLALDEAHPADIGMQRSFKRTSCDKSGEERHRTRVAHGASTQVSVSPDLRVKEFPDQFLAADCGKLVCRACHVTLSLKKSIIVTHLQTERHRRGMNRLYSEGQQQQLVKKSFAAYQKRCEKDLSGTGLSTAVSLDQSVRRIQVVRSFLKAGIPLTKIDCLRPLLETDNFTRLTESSHMAQYIPFLLEKEEKLLKAELGYVKACSVIFDGSTRQGEAFAILVRFIDTEWQIQQRLVSFHILAKSLIGQQLARELTTCLSTKFNIPEGTLAAAIRDGAAVNGSALQYVKDIMYPNIFDIICSSHTLDNVGKHFQTAVLDDFSQGWVALFARSPAARLAWKQRVGKDIKTHCATRWWSLWEIQNQLLTYFGDVVPFLNTLEACPATRDRLLGILNNEDMNRQLCLQLAVTVDAGLQFVTKTYELEGDGDIIVDTYTFLQEIATAAALRHYPNTKAMADKFADGDANYSAQMFQQALECVLPAITYFLQKFNRRGSSLFEAVQMFKAIRIFCPAAARKIQLQLQHVDQLRLLPALNDDAIIQGLKDELAAYITAAADQETCPNRLLWWKEQSQIPKWQDAAKFVFALVPSSAAAERVFSLLEAATSSRQGRLLQDQLEVMLQLQYNRGRQALQ